MSGFRFEVRAESWLVGLGGVGPYFAGGEDNWVVPLWREFLARQTELAEGYRHRPFVSPCHGRESEFTFYGGVEYPEAPSHVPEGMHLVQLPSHSYAVGTIDGGPEAIAQVYERLPAWVTEQGRRVDHSILWLEIYPELPVLAPEGPFSYEVWLPLLQ